MPKRGEDAFSVFRLADGRYRATAQIQDEFGRSRPKSIERKTRAAARAAMVEFLRKEGRLRPSADMTLLACCDAYLKRCEQKGRAPSTIRDYKKYRDGVIARTIGHLTIRQLTGEHIEAMMAECGGTKAAINCRAFVRAAINKVPRKADPSLGNAAAVAEPDSYAPATSVRLTEESLAKVLDTETDPQRLALWLLFADTGLRPKEARNLTWFELRWEADGLWVVLKDSKREEGKKPVPVSSHVAEAIKALPRSCEFVFPNPTTKRPWHEATVRDYWKLAQQRAGVPATDLYKLRHFFGSKMARQVKDDVLRRLMRHTDVRTTKQYYVEPFPEDLRAVKE